MLTAKVALGALPTLAKCHCTSDTFEPLPKKTCPNLDTEELFGSVVEIWVMLPRFTVGAESITVADIVFFSCKFFC
jgi:hypothetical protein